MSDSKFDWDVLASLGLPITGKNNLNIEKNEDNLIHYLKMGCQNLLDFPDENSPRMKESIESLLLAIKGHYPTIYKSKISKIKFIIENFTPKQITGRHLKLRRIALSTLGKYL